jgi:type II secretory ATPase GspE/PulE/Tfp pilus assembly ATPase PilB-like protein
MGAEPFLVASVLEGLLAQRLGRRLCGVCRKRVPMTEDSRVRLTATEINGFGGQEWMPAGCDECKNSGFRRRLGFFELIRVSSALRQGIAKGLPVAELRMLLDDDFATMRDDGIRKAQSGMTTINEVLRATQDVEDLTA